MPFPLSFDLRRPILTGTAEELLAQAVHPSFRIFGSPTSEPAGVFILAHPAVTRDEIAVRVEAQPGAAGWHELSRDELREFVLDDDE